MLKTERIHPEYANLDFLDTLDLVSVLVADQAHAAQAVQAALPQISQAVERAAAHLQDHGRLLYVGAGTSGRLAQLDAVELPPTFSWPPKRAVSVLAGGHAAQWQAQEGAEDNREEGAQDLQTCAPLSYDVLIAVAASGVTPYVLGALEYAKSLGMLTIGMANNPDTPLLQQVDCPILLDTGSEVIHGSTRLKAGTAQKIALNTISSAIMVRLGKVYRNFMVDVVATNSKLRERATTIVCSSTGVSREEAAVALEACEYAVGVAIVMIDKAITPTEAAECLRRAGGRVRVALEQ